jgi:hypothetical protein
VGEEDNAPFALRDPAKRMDVTLEGGQMLMPGLQRDGSPHSPPRAVDVGKAALLDISLTDPACPTYAAANAAAPGHSIRVRTEEKYNNYQHCFDAAKFTLIPLVLDIFGSSGPHFREFIRAVARHQHERSKSGLPISSFVKQWRQCISVALQRCISVVVARLYRKTRRIDGAPAPDVLGYLRIKLLALPQPLFVAQPVIAVIPNVEIAAGGEVGD